MTKDILTYILLPMIVLTIKTLIISVDVGFFSSKNLYNFDYELHFRQHYLS